VNGIAQNDRNCDGGQSARTREDLSRMWSRLSGTEHPRTRLTLADNCGQERVIGQREAATDPRAKWVDFDDRDKGPSIEPKIDCTHRRVDHPREVIREPYHPFENRLLAPDQGREHGQSVRRFRRVDRGYIHRSAL
jgi:hypothetical protein